MRLAPPYLALLIACLLPGAVRAQLMSAVDPPPLEVQLRIHMDSLMNFWPVAEVRNQIEAPGDIVPALPENPQLQSELAAIGGTLKFRLNERVRHYIDLFTRDRRAETQAMLGVMEVYLPQIQHELQARKLPLQLQYLPAVLSAGNPLARGSNGRSGLWQLPYHAALRYGLECGPVLDERRDPERATPAALAQLSDLFRLYEDWGLAVTAFACGPGNVTKARLRTTADAPLEDLLPHLPASGRDSWAALVAMNYVGHYRNGLGLRPLAVRTTARPVTAPIERSMRLSAIANLLPVSQAELRTLNPSLRGDFVCLPGESGAVCIPVQLLEEFEAKKPKLYAASEVRQAATEPEVAPAIEKAAPPVPKNRKEIAYTIQPGDNLGAIAERYGVRVSDLQAWNGLRGTMIRAGEKLKVYVAPGKETPKSKSVSKVKPKPVEQKVTTKTSTYTVRSGDSLWKIAQGFPGVSPEDIMALNGITEAIRPGQVLKIPSTK